MQQEVIVCCQDIPSTGLDRWYKLEARTQRSTIQGRIRLKLWLSTREDRGTSEEDNWGELRQQERLYTVFLNHEMNKQGVGCNKQKAKHTLELIKFSYLKSLNLRNLKIL